MLKTILKLGTISLVIASGYGHAQTRVAKPARVLPLEKAPTAPEKKPSAPVDTKANAGAAAKSAAPVVGSSAAGQLTLPTAPIGAKKSFAGQLAEKVAGGNPIEVKEKVSCSIEDRASRIAQGSTRINVARLTANLKYLGNAVSTGQCGVNIGEDLAGVERYNLQARENFDEMLDAAVTKFKSMNPRDFSADAAIKVWEESLAIAKSNDANVNRRVEASEQKEAVAAFVNNCKIIDPNAPPAGMAL